MQAQGHTGREKGGNVVRKDSIQCNAAATAPRCATKRYSQWLEVCLLSLWKDCSGKSAKRNYISEQPKTGQEELQFISLAPCSHLLTSIGTRPPTASWFLHTLHLPAPQHPIKDPDPRSQSRTFKSQSQKPEGLSMWGVKEMQIQGFVPDPSHLTEFISISAKQGMALSGRWCAAAWKKGGMVKGTWEGTQSLYPTQKA